MESVGDIYLGGIVGRVTKGAGIFQSYNTGSVGENIRSNTYAGGIVGYKDSTEVMRDCYNKGAIRADRAGGLAGSCTGGSVKGCYSSSTNIGGNSYTGALIGYDEVVLNYVAWVPFSKQGVGNIQDSEWTNDYRTWSLNEMKVSSNLLAWLQCASTNVWSQAGDVNDGLPYLINAKPKTKPN